MRRYCLKRLMRRSTRFRRRYISLLNGPCRFMFFLLAIVKRMPRFLNSVRTGRPQYPLSPTSRRGLFRGRPRPGRLTAPPSNKAGSCWDSSACPGVNTRQIGLPLPSARKWTLVLNPPRLRPKASVAGVVFLPPLRVDAHVLSSHPQNVFPNPAHLSDHFRLAKLSTRRPIFQPDASDRNGWTRFAICRIEWAYPAKVPRCVTPIGCR